MRKLHFMSESLNTIYSFLLFLIDDLIYFKVLVCELLLCHRNPVVFVRLVLPMFMCLYLSCSTRVGMCICPYMSVSVISLLFLYYNNHIFVLTVELVAS